MLPGGVWGRDFGYPPAPRSLSRRDTVSRSTFFDSRGLLLRAWIGVAAMSMDEGIAGAPRVIILSLAYLRLRMRWTAAGGRRVSVVTDSRMGAVPSKVGELMQSFRHADLGIAPIGPPPTWRGSRHRAAR